MINEDQATIPMMVRQHITGINPRAVTFDKLVVPPGYKVDEILIDAKYTVEDPGIAAGENFDGVTKRLTLVSTAHHAGKKPVIYLERNTLAYASVMSLVKDADVEHYIYDASELSFDDDQPVTTVEKHAFFRFVGPFPGGQYSGKLELTTISDEFGGVVTFVADVGITVFLSKDVGEPKHVVFGKKVADANDWKIEAINSIYISTTLANIDDYSINGKALSPIGVEHYKRVWNMLLGSEWNAALPTTPMGFKFFKPSTFALNFGTASDMYYVAFKPAGPSGRTIQRRRRRQRTPQRRPKSGWRKRFGFEGEDPTAQEYETDPDEDDEYEFYELDPSGGSVQ
jgi:hypothetical protein